MNSGRTARARMQSAESKRRDDPWAGNSGALLPGAIGSLYAAVNEVDDQVHRNHHHERYYKNAPTLRFMKEARRQAGIDFTEETSEGDASRVRYDRDGNSGNQQDPAHPDLTV